MPRRTDISSVLVIGSGPIVIGQACEFDYSGTQACRVLRSEGIRVVLVNSNPATIMTDPDVADATYVEPITLEVLTSIIAKERPDALLPTLGGQTALNAAMSLVEAGVLERYGVELIGARAEAINAGEDREEFKRVVERCGAEVARSVIAHTMDECRAGVKALGGYPVVVRPSFTMGGLGSGVAYDEGDLERIAGQGLAASRTTEVLLEESILGWKEYELELMRDTADNCVVVCSIENLDPVGVHTGDSVTVAPALTLTDRELQRLRDIGIAVIREVGVDTGGCNIQFAVDPATGRVVVIEMNPRVSRSSALASKATGFPIAKIAARLAVGYTLDEIPNDITGSTPASFEPTLDYVVVKVPRFAFEKFRGADPTLTTTMKSVGEAMAIGRCFTEALQKAMRSIDKKGTVFHWEAPAPGPEALDVLLAGLSTPSEHRLLDLQQAVRAGATLEQLHEATRIDPWFLDQMLLLQETAEALQQAPALDPTVLATAKRHGFSDAQVAAIRGLSEQAVREIRHAYGLRPVYKTVDTCAAEFAARTPYLYSSYDTQTEVAPREREAVIILGSGPNRIGQGIEFDYSCVHATMALSERYETVMVNCNPETVSTDYDTSDRLYFEPVTLEDVLEIVELEKPVGVIVQYGGQTPLKLARALEAAGVPIIGTSPDSIDVAEDRERFQKLLIRLGLLQPPNRTARTEGEAIQLANEIGYPLVVRPSYVLGGRAMEIVHDQRDLERYMREAVKVSNDSPVLLDRFLNDAIEVDVDCLCDGERVVIGGVMEHIEQAGVHSGDSACSLPPYSLSPVLVEEIKRQTVLMAKALKVRGLMNVQFAIQREPAEQEGQPPTERVYVLEVNPRASRTVPFVSKATGVQLAKVAARCMVGKTLAEQGVTEEVIPDYFCIKEAVFPFNKFPGVDTILGPEMKSTGEVMGVDYSFGSAFIKSQVGGGVRMPTEGTAFISVKQIDRPRAIRVAKTLHEMGFSLVATKGTAGAIAEAGIPVTPVNKVQEGRPHVVDMLKNGEISLLINSVEERRSAIQDSRAIRTTALAQRVTFYTTIASALAAVEGMHLESQAAHDVYSLQQLHGHLKERRQGRG